MTTETRLTAAGLAVVLTGSLACAGLVVLLGLTGAGAAVPVGATLSGAVALAGGVVVVRRGFTGGHRVAFRVLLGAASVVYGGGQLLLGLRVAVGGATFPTTGDLVSTLSVPLAIAGLAVLPRRAGESWQGSRLALEAVMLGGSGALLLWSLAFRDAFLPGLDAGDIVGVVILLAELSVLALLLIAAVRELDHGLLLALVGMALYVCADLTTMHAVIQPGGVWPWQGAAIAAAAWPMVTAGLLMISANPSARLDTSAPGAEGRRSLVTATLVCLLLVAFLVTLLADPRLDPVSVVLSIVLLAAYAGCEVVRTRQGKDLLQQVRRLALTDPLTGLPNRRALAEQLRRPRTGPRSVLTLDLDGFKQVNGLLGHAAGDVLLVGVARRLEEVCATGQACVYRLGGDEFAVVGRTGLVGAEELGATVVEAVADVWREVPAARAVDLSASVGVAEVADAASGQDPLDALTASGAALRVAKQTGRGSVVLYTDVLAVAEERRSRVEERLRRALRRGELDMHFQPVVDLTTGALMGLEALARWHDDELGQVSPEEFVPVAEQTGLVLELGAFALERGIEVMATSGAAAAGINVGINASPIELRSPEYVDGVVRLLHRYGVPAHRLVLEVTEGLFVADDDPAIRTLRALDEVGVVIAIDDFGTGYSSLAYLHRLPVKVLKVDRSLTSQLEDPRIRAVMRSVVEIGRALELDIVVEGVETDAMAATARSLGARIGQGWLFSRPVPAAEVPLLLSRTWDVVHEALGLSPGRA